MARQPKPYQVTYAYDVPYYLDFVILAKNQTEAEAEAKRRLANGELDALDAEAQACWENQYKERVFVQGVAAEDARDETLDELLARVKGRGNQ